MSQRRSFHPKPRPDTSWNEVSNWYDQLVGEKGSDYHQNVIIPGALKMLGAKRGEAVLDVACGQGVFARRLQEQGVIVTGIDSSEKLIELARRRSPEIKYFVSDASNLSRFPDKSFDAVSCIMAIMNIDPLAPVIREMARVLKKGGRMLLVMNHPCFRIPRQSGWGIDENRKLCYISNEWADNVFIIDLATSKIADTLKTGSGPAGVALSKDKRYLFVVNSFSNN